MALRTRILLGVAALVLVALSVLDVVTYSVVRNSLLSTADAQLQAASPTLEDSLQDLISSQVNPGLGPAGEGANCAGLPLHSFAALVSLNGRTKVAIEGCPSTTGTVVPNLPASLVAAAKGSSTPVIASVGPARVSVAEVVVLVHHSVSLGQYLLVIGEPLKPTNSTLARVFLLELVVSASILVGTGAAALLLVQLGLRPLEKMAATADEIAAGDLTRRVEESDPGTEVGRLATSFNVMVGRIEQAFRAKEESEERLRRFVADASHELRTPLTSIRGYAELFSNGAEGRPGDLAAALSRIESESTRMSGLVEDLLLLARLDQGRPLESEPVDLLSLASDVARDARVVHPGRVITVSGSGDPVARGDAQRLHQVVTNLVANACTHTPEGTPVELHVEQGESIVRLVVADHGPGIPAEERPRVFDRFWRADGSRQRAQGGNGLGLSIVAAVVVAHGGTVFVTETPGGGATFVVDLPRAAAIPPPAPAVPPPPAEATAAPAGRPE